MQEKIDYININKKYLSTLQYSIISKLFEDFDNDYVTKKNGNLILKLNLMPEDKLNQIYNCVQHCVNKLDIKK